MHTLNYGRNQLTSVPANSFAYLDNITTLLLDWNIITHVDTFAFKGVWNTIKILNLSHNRLTVLPDELGRLTALVYFDVSLNPIDGYILANDTDGFTDDVMRHIAFKLEKFSFGDNSLRHWPKSLTHLNQIRELHVNGLQIDMLVRDCFHGFEQTVKNVTIENASFKQIPIGLETLTVLDELHFDHNRYEYGDQILIREPFQAMGLNLRILTLKNDNFRRFPFVVQYLVNLQNLSVEGNMFDFIGDDDIEFIHQTNVSVLSFRNCGLKRIPSAISELTKLVEVDFSHNRIVTIESGDIENLPNLQILLLSSNPFRYISRNAFTRLLSVKFLDLSNSNVTMISEAIQNLYSLDVFDLTNTRIDCTCDLFWVKLWLNIYEKNVTFYGECETIHSSIQQYVDNRLPNCPQYSAI